MWQMCSGASAVPRKHRTANKSAWKIRNVSAQERMMGCKRSGAYKAFDRLTSQCRTLFGLRAIVHSPAHIMLKRAESGCLMRASGLPGSHSPLRSQHSRLRPAGRS